MSRPLIFALVVLAFPAVAQTTPPPARPAELRQQPAEPKNPLAFCYHADRAYSEGTILEGRECKRRPYIRHAERDQTPLTWQDPANWKAGDR